MSDFVSYDAHCGYWRWLRCCAPGKYMVSVCGRGHDAVVDDFGTLVEVQP